MRTICMRLAQFAVVGKLSLSLVACTCPAPITLDQVFLLDATPGPSPDGGASVNGGPPVDGGAPSSASPPLSFDCTAAAAGCTPGGPCKAACDCVVARDDVTGIVAIESCTLVAQSGPPEVEVRYQQTVFCGGD